MNARGGASRPRPQSAGSGGRRFGGSVWGTIVRAGAPWPRRCGALALVLAVVLAHVLVTGRIAERMIDFGSDAAMPARIEVLYVREMEPTAPPRIAALPLAPAPVAKRRAPRRVAPAASAVEQAMSAVEPKVASAETAQVPAEAASAPEAALAAASAPAEAAASAPRTEVAASLQPGTAASAPQAQAAASAPAAALATADAASAADAASPANGIAPRFEWPGSTRVSYVLTGNYRGEIHGSAQVEWIRIGTRYQMNLDVTVGPSFAPLLTRRMTSEGRLTPEGIEPERYDEDSKVAFRERRRHTLRFEPDAVVMPDGRRRERWPGVQDAASQFVQLTYLFTLHPQLLARGSTIEMPLALPRNVDRWLYDVLGEEPLATPFGSVDTVHLRPRRVARPGGDLTAEIWFAPALAYLPARIRIRQDEQTYIDLVIQRKPQLAQ